MNETIHFRKVFSTDDHNLVISVSVQRSLNSTNLGLNKKRIVISAPTTWKPLYSEPIEGITRRDTRQYRRIWKPKYWHVSRNKILSRSAYRVLSKLPDNHLALLGWKWRPKQSIDNNVAATLCWKEKELPNTVTCKTTHPLLHLESHSTNIVFGSNSDNTPSTDVKTPELDDSENEASFCSAEDSQHSDEEHNRPFIPTSINDVPKPPLRPSLSKESNELFADTREKKVIKPYAAEFIDDIVKYSGVDEKLGVFYHVKFVGYPSHENDTFYYKRCEFPDNETLAKLLAQGLLKNKIRWDQVTDTKIKGIVKRFLPPNFFHH